MTSWLGARKLLLRACRFDGDVSFRDAFVFLEMLSEIV